MIKNIKIKQVHTNTRAGEPVLRRLQNGDLLCVATCDGTNDDKIENNIYVFHSHDNGETWPEYSVVYNGDRGSYCSELTVDGDEITAYVSTHLGSAVGFRCFMYKSYDNGYTWENAGAPPVFDKYTFFRNKMRLSDGSVIMTYHNFSIDEETEKNLLSSGKALWDAGLKTAQVGIIKSIDGGKSYEKLPAADIDVSESWAWLESTVAEQSDGTLTMLIRRCRTGTLWHTESKDGGITWSPVVDAGIPNPSNKPKLIKAGDKIALLNTPNGYKMAKYEWTLDYRTPLALWLSSDDMKTWESKNVLTDFPGTYSYCDGIYEDGHILFTVEHNRHTILFFDVEI